MQGSGSYTDVWQNGQSLLSVWLELFSNACNGEGVLEICHQKLMPQQKKKGKKYSGFCCSYFEKGVYFGRSIFSKSILYSFKKLLNLSFWLEWLLKVIVWAGLTKTCNEINWLKKQIIIGIEVSQILQMEQPD